MTRWHSTRSDHSSKVFENLKQQQQQQISLVAAEAKTILTFLAAFLKNL
jgi:hypothetical protein